MWPSGQRIGHTVQRSRVLVPLRSLAAFVLGRSEFTSSARLVNSQLHFSVILRPRVLVWSRESNPRLHVLQSSAPLTELVLTR